MSDTAVSLRELVEAAVEDWFNHLPDDDEPTIEQIGQGVATAVLAALAGDPGDLPARMAEAIAEYWESDESRNDGFEVSKAASAAISVRWEHAAQQAVEVWRLRAELVKCDAAIERLSYEGTEARINQREAEAELAEAHKAHEAKLASLQAFADRCREKDWAHSAEQAKRREQAEAERDALRAAIERAWELCKDPRPIPVMALQVALQITSSTLESPREEDAEEG